MLFAFKSSPSHSQKGKPMTTTTTTVSLTAQHRAMIARRIRCPQSQDDLAQAIEIELWRKGITDPALVTRVVSRRTINAIRGACRREDRARTYFDGSETAAADRREAQAIERAECSESATQLFAFAGEYESAVRAWAAGEQLDSAARGKAFRGLKRIRERAGRGE
jgi:DNA-directed RNA polymerase specialized sigma24 family protein